MFQLFSTKKQKRVSFPQQKKPSIIEASRFKNAMNEWHEPLKWKIEDSHKRDIPLCISIGGGKGGAGKTLLSSNLSQSLAKSGYKVLIIDLDLGCSNLHSHFSIRPQNNTLSKYLINSKVTLDQIILKTQFENLQIVAGGENENFFANSEAFNQRMSDFHKSLMNSRETHGYDIVIFDLGAGVHSFALDFFIASHLGLLTVLPESTSIENAYAFIKQFLWKMLDNLAEKNSLEKEAKELKEALQNSNYGESGYLDVIKEFYPTHPEICKALYQAMKTRFLGVVINQTRNESDTTVGRSMSSICRNFFGLNSHFLGNLSHDEAVIKALKNQGSVANLYPHCLFMKNIKQLKEQTLKLLDIKRHLL